MKTAVVTGAASGIGQETVKLLLGAGWSVVAADQNLDGLKQLEADLSGDLETKGIDVTDEEHVQRFYDALLSNGVVPSALVNSAGIISAAPLLETSADTFRKTVDINLVGTFLMNREAAKAMQGRAGGSIVNVGSVHSIRGSAGRAAYAASKGGISALTRTLAIELAAQGIRVNEVLPGPIETPMTAGLRSDAMNTALAKAIPLGRVGTPKDVAEMILFLLSDHRSGLITGQSFVVDGGIASSAGMPSLSG